MENIRLLALTTVICLLLLSGCAAQSVVSDGSPAQSETTSSTIQTQSISQTEELSQAESDTADQSSAEAEKEGGYGDGYPELFYDGSLYICSRVYSSQVEVDGEFYEVDSGDAAYLDIEGMKAAGEYLGATIPTELEYYEQPNSELEMNSDISFELYKIDEVSILAVATEPRTASASGWFYSGHDYYENYIMVTTDQNTLQSYVTQQILLKYYPWLSESGTT